MKIFGKELKFNNNKVYHSGDKPTPAEIGAAASSHTHNYAGSSSAGGAANSANTLATARTINGTSFNGSANITTANWGTSRTFTIGNTGKSVNGSGNVSWSLAEIGAANISDGSAATTSVWSSSKTQTEINTSYNTLRKLLEDVENNMAYYNHTHSEYLNVNGGTMAGDLTCNKYFKINAWPGYGSGTSDLWYNGNSGNIHCSSGIRTDKALHSAWHCNFEDGFSIPTRDGGNRRGVLFNTYGSGGNSYLEIARRNAADTDWDWGNSIKFYPNEVKVPSLQCYSGGGCFKLYPGNAGHTYMGFFLNGTTRGAWMGYGSSGSTQFTISADGGTGRVDIHNLNVHGVPLSIQSSAPGCGGVWIQI